MLHPVEPRDKGFVSRYESLGALRRGFYHDGVCLELFDEREKHPIRVLLLLGKLRDVHLLDVITETRRELLGKLREKGQELLRTDVVLVVAELQEGDDDGDGAFGLGKVDLVRFLDKPADVVLEQAVKVRIGRVFLDDWEYGAEPLEERQVVALVLDVVQREADDRVRVDPVVLLEKRDDELERLLELFRVTVGAVDDAHHVEEER